jgi:hypothetical protein
MIVTEILFFRCRDIYSYLIDVRNIFIYFRLKKNRDDDKKKKSKQKEKR